MIGTTNRFSAVHISCLFLQRCAAIPQFFKTTLLEMLTLIDELRVLMHRLYLMHDELNSGLDSHLSQEMKKKSMKSLHIS